jgi:hypothetical protein
MQTSSVCKPVQESVFDAVWRVMFSDLQAVTATTRSLFAETLTMIHLLVVLPTICRSQRHIYISV